MKNAVTYLRVSTSKQGLSGLGLEAQKAAVQKYILSNGLTVVSEFVEIESGTSKGKRIEIFRAIELAKLYGIGCVALANTNHWMRGGAYAWQAAKKGVAFICWTNTIANMPAWGALDSRLGNNPLIMGIPYGDEAIVLDMAISQFSYGAMEKLAMKNQQLEVPGGFNEKGEMTTDPTEIIKTNRSLPVGYWKGSGLSLLLDILAAVLSGGKSTSQISEQKSESALSQVFIAIDLQSLQNFPSINGLLQNIIADYHAAAPDGSGKAILFPGERVVKTRKENLVKGIPVNVKIWEQIQSL